MIKYYGLFDMLNRRNMKKTDLLQVISSGTLSKLSKGENLQTEVIDKICTFLKCQPGDIMEFMYDEEIEDINFEGLKVGKRTYIEKPEYNPSTEEYEDIMEVREESALKDYVTRDTIPNFDK